MIIGYLCNPVSQLNNHVTNVKKIITQKGCVENSTHPLSSKTLCLSQAQYSNYFFAAGRTS